TGEARTATLAWSLPARAGHAEGEARRMIHGPVQPSPVESPSRVALAASVALVGTIAGCLSESSSEAEVGRTDVEATAHTRQPAPGAWGEWELVGEVPLRQGPPPESAE